MTSANSSLVKFIREQKAMLWRRLPLAALSILAYFIYDVFGTVILLQRERADLFSDMIFEMRGARDISALMGIRGSGWFIGAFGAILLAIQGFSFLYKTQTVDFYESRPEKRSTRFFNIVFNGFLIYLVPSLLGTVISILISAANGCAPGWLITEMLIAWVFNTIIFLAFYGMSILASLLTGTIVTAVLMNMFVFGIEALVRLTLMGYRSAYYATFDSGKCDGILSNIYTLPFFNHIMGLMDSNITRIFDSGLTLSTEMILAASACCVKGAVINFLLFAVSMILAFFVYRKRKAESAGKAVIFRPLEIFIKFAAGILFALDTGLFIHWIFYQGMGSSTGPVVFTIILTVLVTSVILESIFALNIRMAFNKAWHMPVIAVIAIAVLFIFKSGITGYDRYLPKEKDVQSAYLVNYNYNSDYYDEIESYLGTDTYIERNMFLTDTEDVLSLASIGQERAVIERNNSYNYSDPDYQQPQYWEAIVGWRLNNGRTVTRRIVIPEDIDAGLMDRIVGQEEFMKGVYHLDDVVPMMEAARKNNPKRIYTFNVYTERGSLDTKEDVTADFLNAYKKDLKEHYNFSMASSNNPVGNVNLYDNRSFNVNWPIYESYENTIAFLDSKGLWAGGFLKADEIEKIIVSRNEYNEETGEYLNAPQEFTDGSSIVEILDNSMSMTYYSAWQRGSILDNQDYSIEVYPKAEAQIDANTNSVYYRSFYRDKMPAFIN